MSAGAGLALLTLGVLADCAGGMGLGTGLAGLAIKGLALGAGGAAGNAVWDSLKAGASNVGDRLRDPTKRLANHDLQALAGRAIAVVVAAAAKNCPGGKQGRQYLERVANRFPADWSTATPDARYGEILDQAIPRFFGTTDGTPPKATALTEQLWETLVGSMAGVEVGPEEQAALTHAAQRLHEQFPRALLELAKEDFSPESTGSPLDGKAFAALLLSLINNTMGGIGEVLTKQDKAIEGNKQVLDELTSLREGLATRSTAIMLDPQDIDAIVTAIKAEIDTCAGDLKQQLEDIATDAKTAAEQATRAADNTEPVAEMHERLKRIEEQQAKTNALLLELRPTVVAAVATQATAKPAPARTATGITNIPAPAPDWIPRKEITLGIRAMLLTKGGTASLTAAVATAAGGYGKTFAARLYAFEHAKDYPGGRFEINVGTGDFAGQLGLLLPLLSPGSTLPPLEAAPIVRDMLAASLASLLIVDNVLSHADWEKWENSGLVPGGHCHVLLTTQKKNVLPNRAVPVPRFTAEEAWTIIAQARPDALDTANVPEIGRALRAADGSGVAVAAIAARMRATPRESWEQYWEALTILAPAVFADSVLPALFRPADAAPDVNQAARHRALLDDCYDHLPAPQQRALDYAALLPQDLAPRPWLETLMDQDATCTQPHTGASVLAEVVAAQLLTLAGEGGELLSLHRLWHARVNERAQTGDSSGSRLYDAVEVLVYQIETQWTGPAIASVPWSQVISLHALSERLAGAGRSTARTAARAAIRRVIPSLPSPHQAIQAQAVAVAQAVGKQVA